MHKTENIYVDAYMLQIGAYMLLTVFIYAAKVTYMYLVVLHICTHTGIYALTFCCHICYSYYCQRSIYVDFQSIYAVFIYVVNWPTDALMYIKLQSKYYNRFE